jgi:hypothetical protein
MREDRNFALISDFLGSESKYAEVCMSYIFALSDIASFSCIS